MRKNLKEIVPSVDANLTFSFLNFLDCFFAPLIPKEVRSMYDEVPPHFAVSV